MTTRAIAGICLCLALISPGQAQDRYPAQCAVAKEMIVMNHAIGTFDVKVTTQVAGEGDDATIGRMTLDKQFHADLEGTSKGVMLAVSTSVKGSAGYVAMEKITGTLKGRRGSFVLQHSGTMTRGAPQLMVSVVPDSGTDQLVGLTGTMNIKIADGKHSYDFEYTVAEAP
ncbi:MAG: DUF3224 domain-containing protein [Candidatus Sulfotelmatobacter sp.]